MSRSGLIEKIESLQHEWIYRKKWHVFTIDIGRIIDIIREKDDRNVQLEEVERKLQIAIVALEKVEDTTKIGHTEPDNYTKLGCLANIASVALEQINGDNQ